METAQSLLYSTNGKPAEVLELSSRELSAPAPHEVQLRLLAAPINPSDFGMILGKYGTRKALPAVGGREGAAEVVAIGADVSFLRVGDRVVMPGHLGTWQSALNAPAAGLQQLPSDLPVELAAMITVNPTTAWRILRDAHLQPDTWVIQNAANSAVGVFVIQMARHLGLKTLNVVRHERWVDPLLASGADVVVLEDSGYEKKVSELTDGGEVALALNSIGGESALRLLNALSPGGTHITIGAMTFDAIRFPTRQLIFDDIKIQGFWMDRWFREQSSARIQIMYDNLFNLSRQGVIEAPVAARFPLSQFREALAANGETRLGKVLLTGEA